MQQTDTLTFTNAKDYQQFVDRLTHLDDKRKDELHHVFQDQPDPLKHIKIN